MRSTSAVLFCVALLPSPTIAADLAAAVSVSSDYVEHGLSRSQGTAAVRAHASWSLANGVVIGAAAGTLDLNPGRGPAHELAFYLGKHWQLANNWSLRTDYARYEFGPTGARGSYDYTEVSAALAYRSMATLSVGYSPDYSLGSRRGFARERSALNYALSVRYPVWDRISLTAGTGHYDVSDLFGTGFWYWSAGAQLERGRYSFAVSFIETDNTALRLFSDRSAGQRVAATLAVRLP
jgi:uncharacterized protein (TIGR02001 family)